MGSIRSSAIKLVNELGKVTLLLVPQFPICNAEMMTSTSFIKHFLGQLLISAIEELVVII